MRIGEFGYHRPVSLPEAVALSRELGRETLFLAGGTEVVPEFKRGRGRAKHLVSLRGVPDLRGIRVENGALVIGAMTPHQEVVDSETVRDFFPALAEAAGGVGSVQIRRQGTIGGNFCGAVPCADTPPAAIVGGAALHLFGPNGEREMEATEFFVGPRHHSLEADELLVAVRVPAQPPSSGAAYARFGLRGGMSVAVASVAARVVLDGDAVASARLCLGAVAPVPLLAVEAAMALAGQTAGPAAFAQAAAIAARESQPITDIRGSVGYRRELVEVLTVRALEAATARARGGETRT